MSALTRQQFKERWERDDIGGGITYEDIADCAAEWGLASNPKTMPMNRVLYMVAKEAGTSDHEEYKPSEED